MGIRTTMESAMHGARRSPGQPARRPRVSHRVAVGALAVLVAAGYCAFALIRYDTFQTSSYDLVIFDQAVRSYAHFRPGISIIKGVHNGFGPAWWGSTAAMCAVAVLLVPRFAFGGALHPSFYHRDAQEKAAAAADAVVPAGVTVQAVDNLGPQLSARDTVLLWDGDGYTPPLGAPWVVASTTKLQFTFASVREQRRRVALLERSGYTVVFDRDGYIVLHRTGPATGAGHSREATG